MCFFKPECGNPDGINTFFPGVRIRPNNSTVLICIAYIFNHQLSVLSAKTIDEEGDALLAVFFRNIIADVRQNKDILRNDNLVFYVAKLEHTGRYILQFLVGARHPHTVGSVDAQLQCITIFFGEFTLQFKCFYLLSGFDFQKMIDYPLRYSPFPVNVLRSDRCLFNVVVNLTQSSFLDDLHYLHFIELYGSKVLNNYNILVRLRHYCESRIKYFQDLLSLFWSPPLMRILRNMTISTKKELILFLFNTINIFVVLEIKYEFCKYVEEASYTPRTEVFGNCKHTEVMFLAEFPDFNQHLAQAQMPCSDYYSDYPDKVECPGFYTIVFEEKNHIPILPIRDNLNPTNIYPIGVYSGTYWYEEILFFLSKGGTILRIERALLCKKNKVALNRFYSLFTESMESLMFFSAVNKCPMEWLIDALKNPNDEPPLTRSNQDNNKILYGGNPLISYACEAKLRVWRLHIFFDLIEAGARPLLIDKTRIIFSIDKKKENLSELHQFFKNKKFSPSFREIDQSAILLNQFFYMFLEKNGVTCINLPKIYNHRSGFYYCVNLVLQNKIHYDKIMACYREGTRYPFKVVIYRTISNKVITPWVSVETIYIALDLPNTRAFLNKNLHETKPLGPGVFFAKPTPWFT